MKKSTFNHLMVLLMATGLTLVLSSGGCSGDEKSDNDQNPTRDGQTDRDDSGNTQGGGNGGSEDQTARALTVNFETHLKRLKDVTELGDRATEIDGSTYHFDTSADERVVGTVEVAIEDLPVSVAELKKLKLPEGMTEIHQSPYLQPILLVAALNQLNYNKETAKSMINYIVMGTNSENRDAKLYHFPKWDEVYTDVYTTEWSQANQYTKFDKVRGWLNGATYGNNYTPTRKPYTMTLTFDANSYTSDWDVIRFSIKNTQHSTSRYFGVWMYDDNHDGLFDTFWTSGFIDMLHSVGEY